MLSIIPPRVLEYRGAQALIHAKRTVSATLTYLLKKTPLVYKKGEVMRFSTEPKAGLRVNNTSEGFIRPDDVKLILSLGGGCIGV